jgi:hypothetical protein
MNPNVFCDPQVIPELVPPRGRGRPTIYSQELVDEFCELVVDGMTVAQAAARIGGPARRSFMNWLDKYPEFRRKFEEAVLFRNQCWMDDTVDIADNTKSDVAITFTEDGQPVLRMVSENTRQRQLKCEQRWKQLRGARLKAVARPADNAKPISEQKGHIVEDDPVHRELYQWEIEYHKRRAARANGHPTGTPMATAKGTGTVRSDK